jgi:hypothetical protein
MFGSLIAQQFTLDLDWPLGAALSIVLMVSVAIVVTAVFLLTRLAARWLAGATRPSARRRAAVPIPDRQVVPG